MKKQLLILTTLITTTAVGTSLYLTTLPNNPTDIQKDLSNTTNAIAITGATAIFGLLDDEDEDNSTDD